MFLFTLPVIIALQLVLSLTVYFTQLNKRPGFLLFMLAVNIVMGFVVPWFIGVFLWGFLLGLFSLGSAEVLSQALTGASALTLFITIFIPFLYFKAACIPLVRDASQNYGNCRRAAKQGAAKRKPA